MINKVEEMKCQLTARNAELVNLKGRMSILHIESAALRFICKKNL